LYRTETVKAVPRKLPVEANQQIGVQPSVEKYPLHASVESVDPGEPIRVACADTDAADPSTLIWPVA